MQFPVSAPPHGGSSDREAEFAAMKAQMEALKLANQRLQGEVSGISHCLLYALLAFSEEMQAAHFYSPRSRLPPFFLPSPARWTP